MVHGGCRDRCSLHFTVGGDHLQNRAERLASELARYGVGTARIRIDNAQQPNRLSLLFQFLVDSGMISSKDAHAHDSDGDRTM
jgi:hypothetical protein